MRIQASELWDSIVAMGDAQSFIVVYSGFMIQKLEDARQVQKIEPSSNTK